MIAADIVTKPTTMPKKLVGDHDVHWIGDPRRLAAYADGAGVTKHPYFKDDVDLVGFLDYYVQPDNGDGKGVTLHIGFTSVRSDHRRLGIARSLIDRMLAEHPEIFHIRWGKLMEKHCENLIDRVRTSRPETGHSRKIWY